MSDTEASNLVTIGDIADALGVKIHRVRHYLETRKVAPVTKIGGYRVWNRSVIGQVRQGLNPEGD